MSDNELQQQLDELAGYAAALQQELTVYSEILANVLHEVGPVVLKKGNVPDPKSVLDVDFDPKGEFAVVKLVTPDGD
jgi:hypothetical protein